MWVRPCCRKNFSIAVRKVLFLTLPCWNLAITKWRRHLLNFFFETSICKCWANVRYAYLIFYCQIRRRTFSTIFWEIRKVSAVKIKTFAKMRWGWPPAYQSFSWFYKWWIFYSGLLCNAYNNRGGKHVENFRYPQILLVGPIWRCFSQKTIYFLWKFGSLPAISKIRPHHYKGQISKLSKHNDVTYQNVCEKGTKPMEKKLSRSVELFLRKVQKTT